MKKVKLVGILNITPDSFSDGGLYNKQNTAIKQLEHMLEMDTDVIDIGAISTRPQGKLSSAEEEINRFKMILPSLDPILRSCKAKISIDSFNYETLKYLLDIIPIDWINDQSGAVDENIIKLVKEHNLKIVIMHNIGLPADPKNIIPVDLDIVEVVKDWFLSRLDHLKGFGIKDEQIILDPGVGFGKTSKQSWKLIKEASSFVNLGFPILYGHSRKSFLNIITTAEFAKRDLDTAIVSYHLVDCGVEFLRVHDIDASRRMLKIRTKIGQEI
jgi:dihydropteroate synthase